MYFQIISDTKYHEWCTPICASKLPHPTSLTYHNGMNTYFHNIEYINNYWLCHVGKSFSDGI